MQTTMAERLIYLREKNNLSQTAVAKQLGVTSSLISAYEKQERKPSIDTLVSLADIYHVSTDYILGRTYHDDSILAINVGHLNNKQIKIIRELVDNMN
jgi:transcriptional regulator with XRE-family HTH domain